MSLEDEEAYRHFRETLENELTQNVKPVIMSLTMLAEDYHQHSSHIARAIEEYVMTVSAEIKILGLYLMDSIMKNLRDKTDYIDIFERIIVGLFCKVFNSVNEVNRKALYKLRQTWNELFSNRTLYEIDVRVQKIDPAWPITAQTNTSTTPAQVAVPSRPSVDTVLQKKPSMPAPVAPPSAVSKPATVPTTPTPPLPPTPASTSTVTPTGGATLPRDPRLVNRTSTLPQTARNGGNGGLSPNLTNPSTTVIVKKSPPKPTATASETSLSAATNSIGISSNSDTNITGPSALVKLGSNLKRASSSDLNTKTEIKKAKTVSPPPTASQSPSKTPAPSGTKPSVGQATTSSPKAPKPVNTINPSKTSSKRIPSILDLDVGAAQRTGAGAKPTGNATTAPNLKPGPVKITAATASVPIANEAVKAAAVETLKTAGKAAAAAVKPVVAPAANPTTGVKSIMKKLNNLEKISASASAGAATSASASSQQAPANQNNHTKTVVTDSNKRNEIRLESDVDERIMRSMTDVDERFIPPTVVPTVATEIIPSVAGTSGSSNLEQVSATGVIPSAIDLLAAANLLEPGTNSSLANITNHPASNILTALLTRSQVSPPLTAPHKTRASHDQENSVGLEVDSHTAPNSAEFVSYAELPALRPRDSTDSFSDSLLVIDGRQYRLAPNTPRLLRIYYHDHEVLCDTRTKDVYIDKKRVAKMGDQSKEVTLNGRRVRLMYMGQRIEVWIDGVAYQLRADSPPKQISILSSHKGRTDRYYVTVDSRTMDMLFNSYRVCQINPHLQPVLMARLSPDDFEEHEISFVCPPKRIMIDGFPRKMRYDLAVPCIEMSEDDYHAIKFDSTIPKEIYIDDVPYVVPFDRPIRVRLNGRPHELAWGGPGFEIIIDGRPYELQFNKPAREIVIGTRSHYVYILGPAPDVKILGRLPPELLEPGTVVDVGGDKDAGHEEFKPPAGQPQPLMNQIVGPNSNLSAGSSGLDSVAKGAISSGATNVQQLLEKLIHSGLIQPGQTNSASKATGPAPPTAATRIPNTSAREAAANEDVNKIPDLTSFDTDLLKQKYPGAIKSIYQGQQCSTCGNRFPQQSVDGSSINQRLARHLDWHFRQKKKAMEEANKAHSRTWYYSIGDWMLYEELSDEKTPASATAPSTSGAAAASSSGAMGGSSDEDLDNGASRLDDGMQPFGETVIGGGGSGTVSGFGSSNRTCAATDDIGDSCCICNDPFEIFWFAEKEEWHFKDAMRVDNKLYHPICFEDAREEEHNNSSFGPSCSQSFMETDANPAAELTAEPEQMPPKLVKEEPV